MLTLIEMQIKAINRTHFSDWPTLKAPNTHQLRGCGGRGICDFLMGYLVDCYNLWGNQ